MIFKLYLTYSDAFLFFNIISVSVYMMLTNLSTLDYQVTDFNTFSSCIQDTLS